ncbi:MAG: T9SS C-terminal target domain-containing protein [candidate division Zixibacteria bacterium]|nr:T9SS C-terminal target domain-containing protein [candidate division Zixibacteria bacterium]
MFNKFSIFTKLLAIMLALSLIVIVAGCSDDDTSTTPTPVDEYFTDDDIAPGDSIHLTADQEWVMDGFVFVDDGAVLSIEAGAVLKFNPGQGADASALICGRNGKIYMNGTADNPIIMTATADDTTLGEGVPWYTRGLWGGLVILGNAPTNNGGDTQIEGIPETEARGAYGGSDAVENSGIIRYVSIRHGGSEIGAANEINGLTLGAVGGGTTIDYVEVFANKDDGVEFFGGTPNTTHMAVAFCGDDCFDYDEGYNGNGQFWFAIQAEDAGNRAGEHDGATGNEQSTPYAIPIVSNATYIGSGADSPNGNNDRALYLRDNAGGKYHNSIIYDFNGVGLKVEDLDDPSLQDSRARLEAGDIVFANNIWYSFGAGNTLEDIIADDFVRDLLDASNTIVDPQLVGIDRSPGGGLDPSPAAGSPAGSGAVMPSGNNGFTFENVNYKGAFAPGENWLKGWTALDFYGFLQ